MTCIWQAQAALLPLATATNRIPTTPVWPRRGVTSASTSDAVSYSEALPLDPRNCVFQGQMWYMRPSCCSSAVTGPRLSRLAT